MTTTVEAQTGSAWSYSALKNYETCPKRYHHYNVLKDVDEPESAPIREGKLLHAHFEARLLHGTPLPLGFGMFEGMLSKLIAAPGTLFPEQKLAITGEFQASTYFGKRVWFRTVTDVTKLRDGSATVLDWKTGKPNEDHTQLQLMAMAIFIHMPSVERVKAGLVFVNHEQTSTAEFVREDQAEIWGEILPRVRVMQTARATNNFPAKPSGLCRRYCSVTSCPYHGRGG